MYRRLGPDRGPNRAGRILSNPKWRLLALFAVVAVLTAAAGAFASASNAAWNCGSGYCTWGYNYVGSGVNQYVSGPSDYWTVNYLNKNSGDTVQWGTGPVDGCDSNKSGTGQWSYLIPPGCGSPSGYVFPYVTWISGNTSYLQVKVTSGY